MLRLDFLDVLGGKLLGEYIEYDFHIVIRGEMAVVLIQQYLVQFHIVDDISVVRHDDPERRIDEKRLGILSSTSPYGWITGVADPDVAFKAFEVVQGENVSDQTVSLFCVEMPIVGNNPCRVLAPVLNRQEPLIQVFEDITVSVYPDNSAHLI